MAPTTRFTNRRVYVAMILSLALVTTGLVAPGIDLTAQAAGDPAARDSMSEILSEIPTNNTPNINGETRQNYASGVAEVGGKVVVGGNFSSVRNPGSSTNISRQNIFAYNAATGAVDTGFAPQVNGLVDAVVAHPNGDSVFIVGNFSEVNGQASYGLALLDIDTGQRVPGFNTTAEGRVRDAILRGNALYLGGDFWRVGGVNRNRLAAIDINSGAVLPLNVPITDARRGTSPWVASIDVNDDGTELAVIGNFLTVGGQPRTQIAVVDLSTPAGSVLDWRARDFEDSCNTNAFWTYMRDTEFSPDGEYLTVATTGGPYTGQICDTISRLEMADRGEVEPSWINWSGGDTLTALAVTDGAVYVGGHQRWMNNHQGRDNIRIGAVDRPGLAALDPINGVPLSWNPTRDRGATVHTLYVTPDGSELIMGHDTDIVANRQRHKIAAFPLGTNTVPQPSPVDIPVELLQAQANNSLTSAIFDGDDVTARTEVPGTGVAWGDTYGLTLEAGWVFSVDSSGNLYRRSYDGSTFGAAEDLTTGAYASTSSFYIPRLTSNSSMTWDAGKLFFSRTNSSLLRYQYLSLESGLLGSETFTVSTPGLSWSTTTAMEVIGDHLYRVRTDGGSRLYRLDMVDGVPTGPEVAISGPGIDGREWTGRDFFAAEVVPPPSVEIVAPEDGATLSGEVTLEAETSTGVTSVEFRVDDLVAGVDSNGSDGWSVGWNSAAVPNGDYALTAIASTGAESATSDPVSVTINNALSAEVLLVVGDPGADDPDDTAIEDRLSSTGYSVEVIDDNALVAGDANGKAFVIIASSANATAVGTKLNSTATPLLVAKPFAFGTVGMTGTSAGDDYGSTAAGGIDIVDPGHPLANGQTGNVALRPATARYSWGEPVNGATVVAEVAGNPTIFTIPAGTTLANGSTAAGCRMSFPLFTNAARWYSETGWSMFDTAASWATGRCLGLSGPPAPDNPPSVSLTAPGDGATVADTVTITADANDDDAVTSVEFTVDGASIGTDTDGGDGWSMDWDTTSATDDTHTLGATATDSADQTTDADPISVTVNNAGDPGGTADEVLLVVGNASALTPDDDAIVDRLESDDYEVTTVTDTSASATDADGVLFVLIANSVGNTLGSTFNGVTVPVWNAKPSLFPVMGLTSTDASDRGSTVSTVIDIVAAGHPMAGGINGPVAPRDSSGRYSWGVPAAAATIVATVGDNPTAFVYGAGSTLANGETAPACRFTFPLFVNNVRWYNNDGWQLFDAAADWAASGCD